LPTTGFDVIKLAIIGLGTMVLTHLVSVSGASSRRNIQSTSELVSEYWGERN
jgi:hypothetical protein